VQERSGRASIAITMDLYSHTVVGIDEAAAEAVAAAVFGSRRGPEALGA
jgi:hypothetical protein